MEASESNVTFDELFMRSMENLVERKFVGNHRSSMFRDDNTVSNFNSSLLKLKLKKKSSYGFWLRDVKKISQFKAIWNKFAGEQTSTTNAHTRCLLVSPSVASVLHVTRPSTTSGVAKKRSGLRTSQSASAKWSGIRTSQSAPLILRAILRETKDCYN